MDNSQAGNSSQQNIMVIIRYVFEGFGRYEVMLMPYSQTSAVHNRSRGQVIHDALRCASRITNHQTLYPSYRLVTRYCFQKTTLYSTPVIGLKPKPHSYEIHISQETKFSKNFKQHKHRQCQYILIKYTYDTWHTNTIRRKPPIKPSSTRFLITALRRRVHSITKGWSFSYDRNYFAKKREKELQS